MSSGEMVLPGFYYDGVAGTGYLTALGQECDGSAQSLCLFF